MELNINSPGYFATHYGIDDDVYRFCQSAYMHFRDKEYSETLHTIGIVPSAAPREEYDSGKWKEKVTWRCYNSCAAINIRMDFDKYFEADSQGKILLTREMILKAVKKVSAKGKFDYKAFEQEFNRFCEEV
ncbi:MAG: hypothetical protein IJ379_10125 [Lachnospiraceae bacterium]|nr:hypothetical protein [Lachnospiraceae bacterium]